MTNLYVQKEEVALPAGARYNQIFGIILQLIGLGLIAVVVVYSLYALIAVAALVAAGLYLTQRFYSNARKYEYAFNETRLLVVKTNLVGQTKQIANVAFVSVLEFSHFADSVGVNDIVAAADVSSSEVRALVFGDGTTKSRLLFAPDEYLTGLINDLLATIGEERAAHAGASLSEEKAL